MARVLLQNNGSGFTPPSTGSGRVLLPAQKKVATTSESTPNIFQKIGESAGKVDEAIQKPAYDLSKETDLGKGVAKGAGNALKSLFKFGYNTVKSVGQSVFNAPSAVIGASKEAFEAGKSEALAKNLEAKAGKPVMNANTGKPTDTSSNLPTTGSEIKDVAVGMFRTPVTDKLSQGKVTEAIQSVAEDPYQLTPYFLAGKGLKEGFVGEKNIAPFEKSYNPEAAAAFKEAGIKPPVSAVTDSQFVQGAESLGSKSVFGKNIIDTTTTALDQIEGKTNDIINKIKPEKVFKR